MQIAREKLNPTETAEYVGISYGYLMRLVRERKIPSFRIGNRAFFFQDSIDRWLAEKEHESIDSKDLNN